MVAALLRTVFVQAALKEAKDAVTKALAFLEHRYPEPAAPVRDAEDDVRAHRRAGAHELPE